MSLFPRLPNSALFYKSDQTLFERLRVNLCFLSTTAQFMNGSESASNCSLFLY